MKDPDIELAKWKLERKKGMLSFVIRSSIPAIIGVIIGRSIEPLFFSEVAWSWAQANDLLINIAIGLVVVLPLSSLHWWWRERKYQQHIARFEHHT